MKTSKKTYAITFVKSDVRTGIHIKAFNYVGALRKTCEAQGIGEKQILYWAVVPTVKQIKQTKNLMRML